MRDIFSIQKGTWYRFFNRKKIDPYTAQAIFVLSGGLAKASLVRWGFLANFGLFEPAFSGRVQKFA